MARRTFLGHLRLALLLAVLAWVALGAWLDRSRSRDWNGTLRVTVYPAAAAGDPVAGRYAASLTADDFAEVAAFLGRQARDYGVSVDPPVRIRVSQAAPGLPPALPERPGPLTIAAWSLRLRWYAARVAWKDALPSPDIQIFATFAPIGPGAGPLPDSVGLSKGLVVVAHLYAGAQAAGSNQVVLAHELLHTLGATDKYEPATGQPTVPDGLGEPDREPPYPQRVGEIMAGRIATGPRQAVIAPDLSVMRIGPLTAREIGWAP
ncbi:MAG TPA: hypothetical protein VF851_00665 [Steroidobacteraceae bacterium]